MSAPPLLSLCIPTFSRAEQLRRSLTAVSRCLDHGGLRGRIQICVSDNASPDGTPSVVAEARRKEPDLVYDRLSENVGFARNFRHVAGLAAGDFVALVGDDDVLTLEALPAMLDATGLGYDVVLFNSHHGEQLERNPIPRHERLEIRDGTHLVERLGIFHGSFIGNLMMRRDVFLRHYSQVDLRSVYPHFQAVLRALREKPALFVNERTLVADDSSRAWVAWAPVFSSIDMARVLTENLLQFAVSRRVRRRTYGRLMRSLPRAVLAWRDGRIDRGRGNPYRELAWRNVVECYRTSRFCQLAAVSLYLSVRCLPRGLTRTILGRRGGAGTCPAT